MSNRKWLRPAASVLTPLLLVTTACGSDDSGGTDRNGTTTTASATSLPPVPAAALQKALDDAVAWLAGELPEIDAYTLAFVDYAARRYRISELDGARPIAERKARTERPATAPELRLIRPDVRVATASLTTLEAETEYMLIRSALACDEPGTPAEFEAWLRAAAVEGGYALTHAGAALGIEAELGCPPTGGTELRVEVTEAIATAVAANEAVDDLAVEQMAILEYLGARDRIPAGRIAAVVAAQQGDGSLAAPDETFQRHLMMLTVWTLAGQVRGDDPAVADPAATLVLPG